MEELHINEELNIIKIKNIIVIVAIVTLIATIYFNENSIDSLLNKPYMDDQSAKSLEIGISSMAVFIILVSIYVAYKECVLYRMQSKDSTASELKLTAFSISFISACILFYVATNYFEEQKTTGDEPIV